MRFRHDLGTNATASLLQVSPGLMASQHPQEAEPQWSELDVSGKGIRVVQRADSGGHRWHPARSI